MRVCRLREGAAASRWMLESPVVDLVDEAGAFAAPLTIRFPRTILWPQGCVGKRVDALTSLEVVALRGARSGRLVKGPFGASGPTVRQYSRSQPDLERSQSPAGLVFVPSRPGGRPEVASDRARKFCRGCAAGRPSVGRLTPVPGVSGVASFLRSLLPTNNGAGRSSDSPRLLAGTARTRRSRCSRYFGGIRIPPSRRIVCAFMYGLVTHSITVNASSSALPRRRGNSTDSPSLALKASLASPWP
jgi:hypothetical protein